MQSNAHSESLTETQIQFGLSRMAQVTLQPMLLATIGRIKIYQLGAGWQREVLLDEPSTHQVSTLQALEAALASTQPETILVLKERLFSQEDAEQAIAGCGTEKTVFWEI